MYLFFFKAAQLNHHWHSDLAVVEVTQLIKWRSPECGECVSDDCSIHSLATSLNTLLQSTTVKYDHKFYFYKADCLW